nr:UDP-N-acetylmuramate dehydrogenase [Motiliproteus sp. SC1-56]
METNRALRDENTLHLPARALRFLRADQLDQAREAIELAREQRWPLLVLGGGSNLVLTRDFPGLCLQIALAGISHRPLDGEWVEVSAAAGESWHGFVEHCLMQGWYGLENLALIPGTVGASPIQNIGAYGVEIKDFFHELEAIDRTTGKLRRFTRAQCGFGYRDSVFKRDGRDRYVITQVTFRLRRKPRLNLAYGALAQALSHLESPGPRDLFNAVVALRRAKLPDPAQLPNVGSFFKNPVVSEGQFSQLKTQYPELVAFPDPKGVKLAAGWLIEKAGWKGVCDGGVAVHEAQALVLVNRGGARGEDVLRLAGRIQADIQARFGVGLEIEPRVY